VTIEPPANACVVLAAFAASRKWYDGSHAAHPLLLCITLQERRCYSKSAVAFELVMLHESSTGYALSPDIDIEINFTRKVCVCDSLTGCRRRRLGWHEQALTERAGRTPRGALGVSSVQPMAGVYEAP